MGQNKRRRNVVIAVVLLLIIAFLLFFLVRCPREKPAPVALDSPAAAPPAPVQAAASPASGPAEPAEILTPATLSGPGSAAAGAAFSAAWTGPDNRGDYITIVRADSPAGAHGSYKETKDGPSVDLTAPMEPGAYELRYVTGRSRTILARAPIEVLPVGAALDAVAEVVLGSEFPVAWTGPNNSGDFITIVPAGAPEASFGSYTNTQKGSPVTLTAPPEPGDAELRYVSGQDRKVLARRPIKVTAARVTLDAPAEAVAGTIIDVAWTGPDNAGDYITLVPAETPDGRYGNYAVTSQGSPLKLLTPIMAGSAELRYMTGQGHRVLARRPIQIAAAAVTLAAAAEAAAGADVTITWTGPNNPGDYITVVPKATPDGQYAAYTNTTSGSPLQVKAPKEAGDAEVRYMAGQGNKVLARIPIRIVP